MNLNQEQAVTKMLIAITKKKEKRLVPTLDGLTGDYTVDGVAVIAPEVSFAISLSDDSFPFMPGGSPDMAENVATTSNNETNGMASTEHLIELLGLEDGSACVEATKHGGWLQSVGEANVIKAHLAEINEKMEGGACKNG